MIAPRFAFRRPLRGLGRGTLVVAIACTGGLAVMAQPAFKSSAALVDGLRSCKAITGAPERAVCYDAAVGALLGAVESGDVKLVDREEVRRTRRQLFGITLPDIGILKSDGKDEEELSDLFETTIVSGRQVDRATWRFTTAEGAVWEINNPPRKLKPFANGDKVVFRKASLGYYFIRINGAMGVKGRRVQ
ncbi:MAG: hypothetical protein ACKO01_06385 [Erythrobacter sp.]